MQGHQGTPRDTRKHHYCPFESCRRAVKKLSQHLQYKHPEVSYNERKQLCAAAKVAPGRGARKEARLPPKQLTLHLVLDESAENRGKVRGTDEPKSGGNGGESEGDGGESEGDGGKSKHNGKESEMKELERGEIRGRSENGDGENSGDEERRGNTTSGEDGESGSDREQEGNEHQGKQKMPTHPQESKFLIELRDFATSKHGRSRSMNEARQISLEAGRFLYHANPSHLDEKTLADASALDRYLRVLEEGGATSSTLNAKVSRLSVALQFMSLRAGPEVLPEVDRTQMFMKNWRAVYGKEARRVNREHLGDRSEQPVNFEGTTLFISWPEMKRLARSLISNVQASKPVKNSEIRSTIIWLAGALMLSNHQRPGAVVNVTIDEYRDAKTTTIGRTTYKTFYSKMHKTGTTGRAKLTCSKDLSDILDQYVTHLRPKLAESQLLFPNKDGRPIDHLSRHMAKLGSQFGIDVPTATQSRHDAATAISSAGMEERSAVATMMSHSRRTQERYYQDTKGRQHAAKGYSLMESIREGTISGRKTRVGFTSEETEVITLYFNDDISAKTAPGIDRCRQFLSDHPMNKDPKQVRDKVRNLMK